MVRCVGGRAVILAAIVCLAITLPLQAAESDKDVKPENAGVKWKSLLWEAFEFTAIEHGFRVATQPETRATMGGPFFRGYGRSLDDLHGWGDGDPFFVNYVGHPLQGAVAGFIFVQNDPKYQKAEFGRNRAYWKSRLRATAFDWAYSEQFEFGPLSEATIGHTQAYYPQQGLVDHVITPSVGMAWMLAEDALDRYVVRRIEDRTENPWLRMFARAGINPSRSMANMLRHEVPWHRDTRPGLFGRNSDPVMAADFQGEDSRAERAVSKGEAFVESSRQTTDRADGARFPTFQVGMEYNFLRFTGGSGGAHSCTGGEAVAEYNVNSWLGAVANVGGCKMISPGPDVSGDATFYLAGPRVTWRGFGRRSGRWSPYVQVLGGGNKITAETVYPSLKPPQSDIDSLEPYKTHSLYTRDQQTNSWAMEFGGGVEYEMTSALSLKALEVEDLHTWTRPVNGKEYSNGLRVSTGLVLRFGTW